MHGVDSNVFHSYQYSALALGPLLRTHLLKLIRVISKCGFVLAARDRLELVGVLQLLDPFVQRDVERANQPRHYPHEHEHRQLSLVPTSSTSVRQHP